MSKGFTVTVVDNDTGETGTKVVRENDFFLLVTGDCQLTNHQTWPKSGTVQLTLKGYRPKAVG